MPQPASDRPTGQHPAYNTRSQNRASLQPRGGQQALADDVPCSASVQHNWEASPSAVSQQGERVGMHLLDDTDYMRERNAEFLSDAAEYVRWIVPEGHAYTPPSLVWANPGWSWEA